MIKLLREQLVKIINEIDAGNSNLSDEEAIEAAKLLSKFTRKDKPMSKYEAYTYLGISRATFDNLIKDEILPKGKKQQGFKELAWFKKDLDSYVTNNRKNNKV